MTFLFNKKNFMKADDEQKQIELLLDEFEKNVGKTFFVVVASSEGPVKTNFTDEVKSVNRELQTVTGELGDYPVAWCRLKQQQPAHLKKYRKYSIQSLFNEPAS